MVLLALVLSEALLGGVEIVAEALGLEAEALADLRQLRLLGLLASQALLRLRTRSLTGLQAALGRRVLRLGLGQGRLETLRLGLELRLRFLHRGQGSEAVLDRSHLLLQGLLFLLRRLLVLLQRLLVRIEGGEQLRLLLLLLELGLLQRLDLLHELRALTHGRDELVVHLRQLLGGTVELAG